MRKISSSIVVVLGCAVLFLSDCGRDPMAPQDAGLIRFSVVSGDVQSGVVGTELPHALVIKATNSRGGAISDLTVNFRVTSGGGTMFAGVASTDHRGIAQDYWTLGTSTAEQQRVEVRAVLPTGQKQVYGVFTAVALAGPAARIVAQAGDSQAASGGIAVPIAPAVLVSDRYGNPVPSVAVDFAVVPGSGAVTGPNQVTNSSGSATVGAWTPGLAPRTDSLTATAAGSSISGNPVLFRAVVVAAAAPAWLQLSPSGNAPTARTGHSAVYDPVSNGMIVFGGFVDGVGWLNDLWILADANGIGGTPGWTGITPSGAPPATRSWHSAVYDVHSNRMIVFGGFNGSNALSDVWVLTNATGVGGTPSWMQLQPAGSPPAARFYHSAVYDPNTNRMVVFAGGNLVGNSTQLFDDVWVLTNADGSGGTPTWIQLAPTGAGPGAHYLHTAVYDPASNRMTVFGGLTAGSVPVNDVWVLANANGVGGTPSWIQPAPAGVAPDARYGHSAVNDVHSNRMIVFGGFDVNGAVNDAWVLTSASGVGGPGTWTRLAPSGTPPVGREGQTAVYDPASTRMMVFAGDAGGPDLNDTWVLSNATGTP